MAIQYISNGYTGDPAYLTETAKTINGTVTVSFAEVLQDETLIDPDSEYAAEFRDPNRPNYASVAEAKSHGVTMVESTIGSHFSMTFNDLNEFHDYVTGVIINIKRSEIAAERKNAESDTHRINPLLRMTILASTPEAKDQILHLLDTDTKLQAVPLKIDGDGDLPSTSPTQIDGTVTLTLAEAMQEQTLTDPDSDFAAAFEDSLSVLTFADEAEAKSYGITMSEKTITTHPSITFTDLNQLRDYLTDIIVSMKRYEISRERETPETDAYKLSPLLRVTLTASKDEAKDQALNFLTTDNGLRAVPMVLESRVA